MMKNTRTLFGLLAAIIVVAYMGCKCPACPEQNNIVTNDVDTVSFRIVTNDVDTVSFSMAAPVVSVNGKLEKASIVIDNVDMARMILDDVDTTKYNIEVRPRQEVDTIQQQKR